MLRDQTDDTIDMDVLDQFSLDELNQETIRGYRNRRRTLKAGHPFERLGDADYLRSIGAAAVSNVDGQLHPTVGGLLMFGEEYNIVRHFPNYFLDYREIFDLSIRWTDRLQSSSGEWSGNVCDFYFRVYNKMAKDVKGPFKMEGGDRIDDTPVHKALREALANCQINADYYGTCGVVILKEADKIVLENLGYIRTGKVQMRLGGRSDPRNKALMKMFNLINIGERAGSGVPNIFNIWADEGWMPPIIDEQIAPDRTVLTLVFNEKSAEKRVRSKTEQQYEKILDFIDKNRWYKAKEIGELLGVKERRARELLRELHALGMVIDGGTTKGKKYQKFVQ